MWIYFDCCHCRCSCSNIINCCNCYFRTDIPEDELDEIISSIHAQFNSNVTAAPSTASADDKSAVCTAAVEDRRLRNLRKKLDQIEALKERQQRGDILETNQVCSMSCIKQVYLLTPMDRATLLHVKSTILHCPPSIITKQWVSVDSKLLGRPRNVRYYHIFER